VLHFPSEEEEGRVLHLGQETKLWDFKKALQSKLARQDYNFGGTIFPRNVSDHFIGAEFDANANFSGATFHGGATFSNARFSGKRTSFWGAQFSGSTSFYNAQFSGKTYFREAQFRGVTNFADAQFSGQETDFSGAQFSGQETDFSDAQFSGAATPFEGVQFSGSISFNKAQFRGMMSFSGAQFSGPETDFSEAQFSGPETYIEEATFLKEVWFTRATFREKTAFWGSEAHPVFASEAWIRFEDSRIERPELLTFNTVLLHPGWFINTDVRKVDFTDAKWYGMLGGPEGTLDEEINALEARGVESPHTQLAQACRRLSANVEENREYPLANEFHYWAMDAVRKGSWNHFKGLTLKGLLKKETWRDIREHFGLITTLYWALNGYGVRAARAFWILFAIWLMFAAVYFLLVKSSPFWVFSAPDIWQGIDYARQAAAYSLSALVRLNPRPQSEELNWFQTLVTIEGILGPLQIALLVLAIRRKVMR